MVVTVMAVLVWWVMDRSVRSGLDQMLYTEATALSGLLESERGDIEFEMKPEALGIGGLQSDMQFQILSNDGGILFSSAGLTQFRGFAERVKNPNSTENPEWFDIVLPGPMQKHRALTLRAVAFADREYENDNSPSSHADDPVAWVAVSRPLEPIAALSNRLAWTLTFGVLAAVAISLIASVFAAHRGTKPIIELAENIAGVEPGNLYVDISPANMPVEFDPIVFKTRALLHRIDTELARQRGLTADIAHDLRTPLAGVRTLFDVCLQRPRNQDEYVKAISTAQTALIQMTRLIDNVLTLVRLDANEKQPVPSTFAMTDVIDDAIATVGPSAAARQIRIRVTGEINQALHSDASMVCKSLTNLLGNAVEHSNPSDQVDVIVGRDGDFVAIHVRDQGPGVQAGDRNRIFDRFYRGNSARSHSDGHNGLGLPIARGLARLLGGDVYLDNKEKAGGHFVLRLPLTAKTIDRANVHSE